ncbi:hypothetical protein GGI20_001160 [Coemansia sp. BCRC 34301]|nr:hypothetical protein GGI20_001160 [Coemansia sp. BCRC 34301]
MFFSKGKLEVVLDSPDIVLYGSPREARFAEITGRVVLTSKTPQPASSLIVRLKPKYQNPFNPVLSALWMSDITYTIIKDGEIDDASVAIPHDSTTGQQQWCFAMAIPGNILETVFTPDVLVAYELGAEMRTTSASHWVPFCKLAHSVPICIKRLPAADSAWSTIANEPMYASAVWRNSVEMTAIAGSRIMHDSQSFEVTGVVRPLHKGMRLLCAGFEIRESLEGYLRCLTLESSQRSIVAKCSCDITATSLGTIRRSESVVATDMPSNVRFKMEYPPASIPHRAGVAIDQEIQVFGTLSVPRAYTNIQYDIASGPIRVSHELVFSASIVDEHGQVHSVRLSSGIYVLPQSTQVPVDLPRYEHSDRDILLAAGRRWSLDSSIETFLPSWTGAMATQRMCQESQPPEYSHPIAAAIPSS